MRRLLYQVRNIGNQTARRGTILKSPAINLSVIAPITPEKLAEYVLIEDLNLPGYANTKTATEAFRADLQTILSGTSQRWKLWEVVVHDDYISLHYIDMEASSRLTTDLSLHLSWAPVTELSFNVPETQVPLNNFRISCIQTGKRHQFLVINYDDIECDESHCETYTCAPLIRG